MLQAKLIGLKKKKRKDLLAFQITNEGRGCLLFRATEK